jgi:hypothetical protein
MTVKQKPDNELGYPIWVFGPGYMMIRLFLPDVRRADPDPADGAAEALPTSPATTLNRGVVKA